MNVLADQSLLFPGNRKPSLTLCNYNWYLHLDLYIVCDLLVFYKNVYNVYFEGLMEDKLLHLSLFVYTKCSHPR